MSETEKALREALEGLVARLDYVHADPTYQSVWQLCALRGWGGYSGPTYTDALAAARAALAAPVVEPEKEYRVTFERLVKDKWVPDSFGWIGMKGESVDELIRAAKYAGHRNIVPESRTREQCTPAGPWERRS